MCLKITFSKFIFNISILQRKKNLPNFLYRNINEEKVIKYNKKVLIKKKTESKKAINIARKATNALIFGSVIKKNQPLKSLFPLVNLHKNEGVLLNCTDEISSISIFEGGYKKLPSVRKIIEETMPPERKTILNTWKKKMISKLGEDGFEKYRQGLLDEGHIFHTCIELQLRKENPTEEQLIGIENYWKSIKHIFPLISNVRLLESRVIHPTLDYQGSIDCVGAYKNIPVVMEFKTSSKPKVTLSSTYDDPLQVVAYLGALNYDSSYDSLPNIRQAILVVAYPTGFPAHIHVLKEDVCLRYWALWLQRLRLYQEMQKAKLSSEDADLELDKKE